MMIMQRNDKVFKCSLVNFEKYIAGRRINIINLFRHSICIYKPYNMKCKIFELLGQIL